jgi:hypothetical protein
MGLSVEDFRHKRKHGMPCSVGVALEAMRPAVRAVFTEAMALPVRDVQHVRVAELLEAEGHTVGKQQVGRHRRGECGCG